MTIGDSEMDFNTPEPPMPSTEQDNGVDGGMPQGQGDENIPQMDNNEKDFQTNDFGNEEQGFDPGVEANEEEDPKKFIEQLTGKLSQSLRTYNNESEKPDTELNKYVLGMLVKQASKGMTDADKSSIIKKLKMAQNDMPDMDSDVEDMDDANDMKNESVNVMKEINNPCNGGDEKENRKRHDKKLRRFGKNPFIANR